VILSLILFQFFAHVGLAMATALAAWFNVLLLAGALRRRTFLVWDTRLKARVVRIAGASMAMGAVLWAVQGMIMPWFDEAIPQRILGLALLVGAGLTVYGALALALGALDRGALATLARRPRASEGTRRP